MSRNYLLLFFCIAQCCLAQNRITVLDSLTQNPIPFATVLLNDKQGWITNEEGQFQLPKQQTDKAKDTLSLSSLGYETLFIPLDHLKDSVFYLAPKPFALKEVVLTNRKLPVAEILDRLEENVASKYELDYSKKRVFLRETGTQEFKQLKLKVRRNSISSLNQAFWDSLLPVIPPKTTWHEECLAHSYGNFTKENQKITVLKALSLGDDDDVIFDELDVFFNDLLSKQIKKDSYIKFRSGLFSSKIDAKDMIKQDSVQNGIEDTNTKAHQFATAKLRVLRDVFGGLFSDKDLEISIIQERKKYRFELVGISFLGDTPVYEIDFNPLKKGKFKGKLFVDADRFALVRLEYQNIETLASFKLLKAFYNQFLKTATVQFKQLESGRYALQYCELERGTESGMTRPLNIIEKNKKVRGRRKQNELALDVDLHVKEITKTHLVVLEQDSFSVEAFKALKSDFEVLPEKRTAYDPNFWEGEMIIEPNEAIRNFKSNP